MQDTEPGIDILERDVIDAESDLRLAWHSVNRIVLTPLPIMSENSVIPSDLLKESA